MPLQSLYEASPTFISWINIKANSRGVITVPRIGDLLLYIKSANPQMGLTLDVDGHTWETFDLPGCDMPYQILNGLPLPLICMRFNDVRIYGLNEGDDIDFGYVYLSSNSRLSIALNHWWLPSKDGSHHFAIQNGMGAKVDGITPYSSFTNIEDAHFELIMMPEQNDHGIFMKLLEHFWNQDICHKISELLPSSRPSLLSVEDVQEIVIELDKAIECKIPGWQRVGSKITAGIYEEQEGMHMHREGSLQGGKFGLLIYVQEPEEGGETLFEFSDGTIQSFPPIEGNAILFDIDTLHKSNVVIKGRKGIIACEVKMT